MKPRILITARECMNGENPAWQVNKAYTEAKDIVARVCGEYSIEMATLLAGYGRE